VREIIYFATGSWNFEVYRIVLAEKRIQRYFYLNHLILLPAIQSILITMKIEGLLMEPEKTYSQSGSLLLVEDDRLTRENLSSIIQGNFPGLELHTAENGKIGLELYRKHRPQIVITDINLPVMDGIRMAREIRTLTPSVDIIAISAHNNMHYLMDAINIGISRYVLKPIDHEMLFGAIEECLVRSGLERQVKEQHEYIRKLSRAVEQSPSTIVITDATGAIEYVNPRFTELTGYTPEEAMGQNPRILKANETPTDVYGQLWKTLTSGQIWRGEFQNKKKNGELYWEAASISPLFNEEGIITHFIAVKEDITKHKEVEKELLESEKRYHSLFENMLEGFAYCKMLFDDHGTPSDFVYLDTNSAFEAIIGVGNVIGKNATEVFPEIRKSNPELLEIYGRVALTGHPEKFDLEFKPSNIWLTISVYSTEKGYFVAVFDNITERKQAEEILIESEKRYKELSITDSLTKLYNSRHFFTQLRHEVERASRYGHHLSLILLDIDNFKKYNDSYGHLEGDKVLAVLATAMRDNLRQTDTAYRYGGEEFTVLLPETECEKALIVAERMRKSFETAALYPMDGSEIHMTISVGVGQYVPDEQESSFLERVDMGMYRAKESGKNRVCCAQE
jgi:diguanylate cyclase (GGDEF)-like protein/PAS domain S-box-containing protein